MRASGFNTQISAYSKNRPPKFHEIELLKIIKGSSDKTFSKVLDIGCAAGSFISLMSKEYPSCSYTGFDISSKLIEEAKIRLNSINANMYIADALTFEPEKKYDLIIASGVLSIFEDLKPLELWTKWLEEYGRIYIFGRFNSKDIDTIVRFRNHHQNQVKDSEWQGGLTSFSIKYVTEYLSDIGFKSKFIPFIYPEKLPITDDPVRTYSVETIDNKKLILNGANIIAEQYFLIINKK